MCCETTAFLGLIFKNYIELYQLLHPVLYHINTEDQLLHHVLYHINTDRTVTTSSVSVLNVYVPQTVSSFQVS